MKQEQGGGFKVEIGGRIGHEYVFFRAGCDLICIIGQRSSRQSSNYVRLGVEELKMGACATSCKYLIFKG